MFPIVAYVAQQSLKRMTAVGLSDQLVEFNVIWLGTAVDHGAQEQVSLNIDNG